MTDDTYTVDETAAADECSPLTNTYNDGEVVEFNCPSCDYSILPTEIVKEGGAVCDGCGRTVRLHITSHDHYGEWRNVPVESQEAYR